VRQVMNVRHSSDGLENLVELGVGGGPKMLWTSVSEAVSASLDGWLLGVLSDNSFSKK